MKYTDFINEIVMKLQDFYGNDAKVEIRKVTKNNNLVLDGIYIAFNNEKGVIPIIYLKQFYDQYDSGKMSINECVGEIVDLREESDITEESAQSIITRMSNWEFVKERIYPILISSAENRELVNTLANKSFLDLSVIYVIRLASDEISSATIKITKELFKQYAISEETLHEQAIKNMKNDGYTFKNITQIIFEMTDKEMEEGIINDAIPMFVFTNKMKSYGAAGILDAEFLKEECRGKSFYIIPSSLHETFFVPDEDINQEELDIMVKEVNRTDVKTEEKLADHTYYYDGKLNKVRFHK